MACAALTRLLGDVNVRLQRGFRRDLEDTPSDKLPMYVYLDADGKRTVRWRTFVAVLVVTVCASIAYLFVGAGFLTVWGMCLVEQMGLGDSPIPVAHFPGSTTVCLPPWWPDAPNSTTRSSPRPALVQLLTEWEPGSVVMRPLKCAYDLHWREHSRLTQCLQSRDDLYAYGQDPATVAALYAIAKSPRLLLTLSSERSGALLSFVRAGGGAPLEGAALELLGWHVFVNNSTGVPAEQEALLGVLHELEAWNPGSARNIAE